MPTESNNKNQGFHSVNLIISSYFSIIYFYQISLLYFGNLKTWFFAIDHLRSTELARCHNMDRDSLSRAGCSHCLLMPSPEEKPWWNGDIWTRERPFQVEGQNSKVWGDWERARHVQETERIPVWLNVRMDGECERWAGEEAKSQIWHSHTVLLLSSPPTL